MNNKQIHNSSKMGLLFATALVIGNMIGSGIFLLPSALAKYGGISIFGWLFTAGGALSLALLFSELSQMLPVAGGPYAYTREAFGDFMGFLVAWGYWIGVWSGNAAIAISFVAYLTVWLPLLAQPFYAAFAAVLTIWLLTLINMRDIKLVGHLQLITTILKLIPLLLIGTVGWLFINWHNYGSINTSTQTHFSAITSVATLTLWAFIGIESATISAEHIDQPQKTIPRATLLGTLITAVIYIASTMAIIGILPAHILASSTAPFADATRPIFGEVAYYLFAGVGAISCFGSLNGWILIQGQMPMAAARDKLFPAVFGKLNQAQIPAKGIIISSLLITLLIILNFTKDLVALYIFVILVATLTTLVPYAICAIALPIIMKKRQQQFALKIKKIILLLLLSAITFLYTLWTIYGVQRSAVFYGCLLLLAGIPIYFWQKWHYQKVQGE